MGEEVAGLVLDPTPGAAFEGRWRRKKQADANADEHIATASAATQSQELKRTLRRLIEHDHDVTNALEDEVLRLATNDPAKARKVYREQYRPAEEENMAIIDEALKLALAEANALHAQADRASTRALRFAQIAIAMFLVLGVAGAFYLGRAIARLVRESETAAQQNKSSANRSAILPEKKSLLDHSSRRGFLTDFRLTLRLKVTLALSAVLLLTIGILSYVALTSVGNLGTHLKSVYEDAVLPLQQAESINDSLDEIEAALIIGIDAAKNQQTAKWEIVDRRKQEFVVLMAKYERDLTLTTQPNMRALLKKYGALDDQMIR